MATSLESEERPIKDLPTPREYQSRWLMLLVFTLYSFSNAYQWIHLNIIGNVIIKYYNASLPEDSFQQETAVDWLSMIYMLAYIPLIFPATWLIDKKGLRISLITGAFLNALGAWIKCACVSPDRFPVLMCAQTICAVAQIFVLGIPAPLAAVWFGPNQVSTATAIGVFGNQVGGAIGFLIPPLLVPNSDDLDDLGHGMSTMFYIGAGVTTALFLLILIEISAPFHHDILYMFKDKPPIPPSTAQMLVQQGQEGSANNYLVSLKNLFRNKGFIILTITYGINTGSFYGISTLLNPIILNYFPGHEKSAGRIGLTLIIAGVVGSILAGMWLDKSKTFKATTLGTYVLAMAGMVALTFTIHLDRLWIVFLTAGLLGFFMTGYLPVGFEFAAEITYPEPEATSSGLLNASAQTFGIILTIGMRALMNRVSVLSANISLSAALLLGTLLTGFIPADYRRQDADKQNVATLDNMSINVEGLKKKQKKQRD